MEERKETQSYPVVGLFPGCSHVAADGLSPEAWLSESSCSQVLVLTAGVTAPLCTSGMPGINGLHCGRMHELSRPGTRPMLAWTGVGGLTAHTLKGCICKLMERHSITAPFYFGYLEFARETTKMLVIWGDKGSFKNESQLWVGAEG